MTGFIQIAMHQKPQFVEIAIADDGPSIPSQTQSRVFKLFQSGAATAHKNSGIGLAVSKRMTEAHGGSIALESTDGKRGTTFRILWPSTSASVVSEEWGHSERSMGPV